MGVYIQVVTAVGRKEDGARIAKTLVDERLAACAQIVGPITSIYWWKGKAETAEEWLLFIKSRKQLFKEVEKTIKKLHPYETPEITAFSVMLGSKEYLEWLDKETRNESK